MFFRDSFPPSLPAPVTAADISPVMLGAASWQRSNVALCDCMCDSLASGVSVLRAEATPSEGRRGEVAGWKESKCVGSCLETGGQVWRELRRTD